MTKETKQRLANGVRDRAYKADPVRHSPTRTFSPGLWLLALVALFCLFHIIKTI